MGTVMASGAFAAISGNSSASVAIMGRMALPEMKKYKYDHSLAAGSIAAGGTIGILIPPSMGFILYGILTEQSIGRLFMAGVIPGILEVVFYIGAIFIICQIKPRFGPAADKSTFKEKVVSLKHTWSMILLFLLVMGGIYGGWFTPTEAGAVGSFGAILIAGIARKLNVKNIYISVLEAAQTTAMIVLMVVSAFVLTKLMAVSRLPDLMASSIAGANVSPGVILVLIIGLYIILGMFLDIFAAILLTLPILYPVILSLGFDPIWYGVIMVRVMEVGLITPPMGLNVFIMASVTDEEIGTIFKGVVPFVIADIAHIALLVFVPALSLLLPGLM
jgi:C4-dicarboxylate transporter DctM subunit